MLKMTPTPRLRWVTRDLLTGEHFQVQPKHKVLQQWYAYDINYPTEKGEWKDVPLEKEE